MSTLRVNNITNRNEDGPVTFDNGIVADGSQLTLKPTTSTFSPRPLETNVAITTTITIGFNQNMQFSGTGDIRIREGSASGTITTSFTTGVSTEINISGGVLTIDPKDNLGYGQTYFVTLPSVGIANTLGSAITELTTYQFQTEFNTFNVTGGDFEQVIVDSNSPTGYYKYNIFTTSGIATFSSPSATADSFKYVLVGGGGGGGSSRDIGQGGAGGGGAGGVVKDYNAPNLPAGNYTVTIGGGGSGAFDNPQGTAAPPTNNPTNTSGAFTVVPTSGTNSSFGPTPVGNIIAYGGGSGGSGSTREAPSSPNYPTTTRYTNSWNGNGFAPPQGPTFTGPPFSPSTSSNPTTYTVPNAQWVGGGHPGGSGGGSAGAYSKSPAYYYSQISYSKISVAGAAGQAYPSPNQQGYPGGPFFTAYNPGNYVAGTGGGGAGSAGGAGGIVPGPSSTAGPANGGNGTTNPAFPGPALSLIQNFPTDLASELGPTGLLGGGGGAGGYTTGVSSPWGSGGPGGGGRGGGYINSSTRTGERGVDGTGGGGGGGYASGGPTGVYPTPGPGNWTGQNGGSGIMMIRYAHPGS